MNCLTTRNNESLRRIVLIGNAGGGKSILAHKMGGALNIAVYSFDDLQWRPGWIQTPWEEIRETHARWLARPEWIIDGWGSWGLLEERFTVADTIVFVDFPIQVHYWWAAKRQLKAVLNRNQGWPPEGCAALPVTGRLIKLMWKIHKEMRPQLVSLIYNHAEDKLIFHLKSPPQMRALLRGFETGINWRSS
jgi:hypothetical protein